MPKATAQANFTVAGLAQISLSVSSISQNVQPGQGAVANIVVANSGSASAAVTVSGATVYQGVQQGTWSSKTVTVQPGSQTTVQLQTSGAIATQFAGDTLTAVFTGSWS